MVVDVEKLPLLDDSQIRSLREAMGGDTELIIDLLDTFKREGDAAMKTLQAACTAQDVSQVKRTTHFFSGSAANMGIYRFSQYNRTIEVALNDGELIDYQSVMSEMRPLYDASLRALRRAFDL